MQKKIYWNLKDGGYLTKTGIIGEIKDALLYDSPDKALSSLQRVKYSYPKGAVSHILIQ